MNETSIKYLIFDVESVPDPHLISSVRYPGEDLDEKEVVSRYQEEIRAMTGGTSDFIPVTFQHPIAVCVAKAGPDFVLQDIVSLDEPDFRPGEITTLFWRGVVDTYAGAHLVTFNGRGFDLPLLELMAFRYGISAQSHFVERFGTRYRFGDRHLDLQDWLSNFNAIRMNGGLDLLAKVLGKPGKMETKGDAVYQMYLEGRLQEISDYCIHDVLDTYFVFLRTRVLCGAISVNREQKIVKMAKQFLIDNTDRIPSLKVYLQNWGDWVPWP